MASSKGRGGSIHDIGDGCRMRTTHETYVSAAKFVCSRAADAQDARALLDMLGFDLDTLAADVPPDTLVDRWGNWEGEA